MNGAPDLEVAQKPPGQLIDALWAVEQSQTVPVILSDPWAVSCLWEVLLMMDPSQTWVCFSSSPGACWIQAQTTASSGHSVMGAWCSPEGRFAFPITP